MTPITSDWTENHEKSVALNRALGRCGNPFNDESEPAKATTRLERAVEPKLVRYPG